MSRVPFKVFKRLQLQHNGAYQSEVLAAARTLTAEDAQFMAFDPDGAHRNVILPVEGESLGDWFAIRNDADAAENLVVRNSADDTTIATVAQGQWAWFVCDGTDWSAFLTSNAVQSPIATDTILELTPGAGVTVDGVLLKDSRVDAASALTGVAGLTLGDNLASAWDIKEGANSYMEVCTTNDAERIVWGKLQANPVQTIDMADAAVTLVYGTAGAGEVKITGQILIVDANSSGTEDLTLPPVAASSGVVLTIHNNGGESIVVKDVAAATICTIPTGGAAQVACDGTNWFGLLGA